MWPRKSALGGMWRERRPLGLCCIVIKAPQVLQTGPVAELVLVLEEGRRISSQWQKKKTEEVWEKREWTIGETESSPLSELWQVSGCAASWQSGRCPPLPRTSSSPVRCWGWWTRQSSLLQHCWWTGGNIFRAGYIYNWSRWTHAGINL